MAIGRTKFHLSAVDWSYTSIVLYSHSESTCTTEGYIGTEHHNQSSLGEEHATIVPFCTNVNRKQALT